MNSGDTTTPTKRKIKLIAIFKKQIPRIKAMIAEGYPQREIADSIGIQFQTFKSYMFRFKSEIEKSDEHVKLEPLVKQSETGETEIISHAKNETHSIDDNEAETKTDTEQLAVDFDTLMNTKAREQANARYFQPRALGSKKR